VLPHSMRILSIQTDNVATEIDKLSHARVVGARIQFKFIVSVGFFAVFNRLTITKVTFHTPRFVDVKKTPN
jgi:hypothetical protein